MSYPKPPPDPRPADADKPKPAPDMTGFVCSSNHRHATRAGADACNRRNA